MWDFVKIKKNGTVSWIIWSNFCYVNFPLWWSWFFKFYCKCGFTFFAFLGRKMTSNQKMSYHKLCLEFDFPCGTEFEILNFEKTLTCCTLLDLPHLWEGGNHWYLGAWCWPPTGQGNGTTSWSRIHRSQEKRPLGRDGVVCHQRFGLWVPQTATPRRCCMESNIADKLVRRQHPHRRDLRRIGGLSWLTSLNIWKIHKIQQVVHC